MTVPIVAFVGRSGSGKTTLLERLIPVLKARRLRVAIIKHAVRHAVETDVPGTDTYRFWAAGVDEVALVTPDRLAFTRRTQREPMLKEVVAEVGEVDLIILEGYKRSRVPKVEVVRRACDPEPIRGLEERIAWVTDVGDLAPGEEVPCFGFDHLTGLADFLIREVIGQRRDDVDPAGTDAASPAGSGLGSG